MKFLNKNAYIQTAIFGYSFCTAAKKAFFLIARNIMRVMAVGVVSQVVLILGKVRFGFVNGAMLDDVRFVRVVSNMLLFGHEWRRYRQMPQDPKVHTVASRTKKCDDTLITGAAPLSSPREQPSRSYNLVLQHRTPLRNTARDDTL